MFDFLLAYMLAVWPWAICLNFSNSCCLATQCKNNNWINKFVVKINYNNMYNMISMCTWHIVNDCHHYEQNHYHLYFRSVFHTTAEMLWKCKYVHATYHTSPPTKVMIHPHITFTKMFKTLQLDKYKHLKKCVLLCFVLHLPQIICVYKHITL